MKNKLTDIERIKHSIDVLEEVKMLNDTLWKCPICGRKFSYDVRDTDTFYCSKCGLPLKMEE